MLFNSKFCIVLFVFSSVCFYIVKWILLNGNIYQILFLFTRKVCNSLLLFVLFLFSQNVLHIILKTVGKKYLNKFPYFHSFFFRFSQRNSMMSLFSLFRITILFTEYTCNDNNRCIRDLCDCSPKQNWEHTFVDVKAVQTFVDVKAVCVWKIFIFLEAKPTFT